MRFTPMFALLAGAALAVPQAYAEAPEEGAQVIEEITVTARRREETVQDVPIPVTALAGEALKDRSADDLTDLTRLTPNMNFGQSGVARNTANVFLRGIGQVNWAPSQDPKIGTYVDGVYLGRPQGGVFDFLDIDRVEVLRGPQGTLFGRNTTAGLVHVISNRPTDYFDYSVGAGVGNDNARRVEGMVNLPLNDVLAARLAFQHREADGYVRNTGTGEDWNDENSMSARLSLRWTPNDRVHADLIFEAYRAREKGLLASCEWDAPADGSQAFTRPFLWTAWIFNVYDEMRDTCLATKPYRSNDNDPDSSSDADTYSTTLDLSIDLGFADLTSISSFRDLTSYNGTWGWGTDTVGIPSLLEVLGTVDDEGEQWSQEFRLAGTAMNDRLDWVVGVYAFEENNVIDLDVPIFRGATAPDCAVWPVWCAPSGIPGIPTLGILGLIYQGSSRNQTMDGTNSSQAIFGEVTWQIADAWSLTAGARYSRDKREFERSQTLIGGALQPGLSCREGAGPLRNGKTCFDDVSFTEVTPRAILSWDFADNVMFYFGWSKGYSSGGFNQDVAIRPYDPEISGNWEGGMKSTWGNGTRLLNITAFHNTYENQQITVSRVVGGQPTADLINAQQATLFGIEGEFRVELPANWYTQGVFGWMNGEYDEFTVLDNLSGPGLVPMIVERDLSDTEAVRGAPYTYSLAVGKTQVLGNGGTLAGQVGWAFRGRSYNTLETLQSSRQGKYGLLDARFVWSLPNGQTTISLTGNNLLGRLYYLGAVDLTAPGDVGTISKYWAEPRRFRLEVTHRLGR